MKKIWEQVVLPEDLRDLLRDFHKREKFRSVLLLVLSIIALAALVAFIAAKLCAGKRREEYYYDDDDECECVEAECDEHGCSYTTDEDFEK
ncbi:MAG: hypothetical protein LBS62_06860 [Clostridiales bacterium]|jgi:hypothetical protein|nr:hypothetical protein [Clostridiales bacterium]